ncbi:MAG: WecB/TagA/CpsF family glycosyltransferase [Ignavibacteriae bacterium]|nr:glycosyltransferase [Ignavibacteriota bacterium]NOG96841.1 WecB/TagA/CpsF family glycosyltransferase [Ignavibacteriota bacterium]
MDNGLIKICFKNDLNLITGTFPQITAWIVSLAESDRNSNPQIISHINVFNYNRMQMNTELADEMKINNNLLFDGIGFKIASAILGYGWLPDLNGTDLFPLVMKQASEKKLSLYCLGAKEDVIDAAVKNIKKTYSGVRITGFRSGYFDKKDEAKIVDDINNSNAQILLIGRNFLQQEEFALRHREKLNVSLIWNVGGLYNFISETVPRAPLIFRKLRLEWLFRFLIEPRRMWYRNIIAAPLFIFNIIGFRLKYFFSRRGNTKSQKPAIRKLDADNL